MSSPTEVPCTACSWKGHCIVFCWSRRQQRRTGLHNSLWTQHKAQFVDLLERQHHQRGMPHLPCIQFECAAAAGDIGAACRAAF